MLSVGEDYLDNLWTRVLLWLLWCVSFSRICALIVVVSMPKHASLLIRFGHICILKVLMMAKHLSSKKRKWLALFVEIKTELKFMCQLIDPLLPLTVLTGVLWHRAINVLFKGIYCRYLSIPLLVPVLAIPALTNYLEVWQAELAQWGCWLKRLNGLDANLLIPIAMTVKKSGFWILLATDSNCFAFWAL